MLAKRKERFGTITGGTSSTSQVHHHYSIDREKLDGKERKRKRGYGGSDEEIYIYSRIRSVVYYTAFDTDSVQQITRKIYNYKFKVIFYETICFSSAIR